MKLYQPQSKPIIRVTIQREGEKSQSLSIEDGSLEEAKAFVLDLISRQAVITSPTQVQTYILLRSANGSKTGASKRFSFIGLSPAQVKELIIDALTTEDLSKELETIKKATDLLKKK